MQEEYYIRSPEEKKIIVGLLRIKGLGRSKLGCILKSFSKFEDISRMSIKSLSEVIGYTIARQVLSKNVVKTGGSYISTLFRRGIGVVTLYEKEYPKLLREIPDPPPVLFYMGDYKASSINRSIAIVGTRSNTDYGKFVTEEIVEGLVSSDFTIVSGMAFGIDKIAHETTIRKSGTTIAVLSGRVDKPSPFSNKSIYKNILKNGCVISETWPEINITAGMFPKRNRIISGISFGTIIIEAGEKSGALITAHHALEQGREVFAIPSNVHSKQGVGTNNLIQKGEAKLVKDVSDVLEEFGFESKQGTSAAKKYSPDEEIIIESLINGPSDIEKLSRKTGFSISNLSQILVTMQIEKKVVKNAQEEYVIIQ
jgi:DNA processing protein